MRQIGLTGKERTKAVNEISEVAEKHLVGCGLEDLKADGSQIADMSRVGMAQPPRARRIDIE